MENHIDNENDCSGLRVSGEEGPRDMAKADALFSLPRYHPYRVHHDGMRESGSGVGFASLSVEKTSRDAYGPTSCNVYGV